MHCLVINLAAETERMKFMSEQLDRLGLKFERLEAVESGDASTARSDSYWNSWARPLGDAERACLLSHIAAWNRVAEMEMPVLILEDDAILSAHTPGVLAAAGQLAEIDRLTLEVRQQRKTVARAGRHLTPEHRLHRLFQDRSGAVAYLLWPSGARMLLENASRRAGPADAVISLAYELRSFQIEPACAVQLDRAARYGLAAPIRAPSTIGADREKRVRRWTPGFRLRRIGIEMGIAVRVLCHAHHARRRQIRLDRSHFIGGQR